jgi:hypothetical protein
MDEQRFKNMFMRVIKCLLMITEDRLITQSRANAFLAILAGLATGSFSPIPNISAELTHEYLRLYSSVGLHPLSIDIENKIFELPERDYSTIPTVRAGWYAYILLRFTLRPHKASTLIPRLERIAVHHHQMIQDAVHLTKLIALLSQATITRELVARCDWWNNICLQLTTSSSNLSRCTTSKLQLLARRDSVIAYREFVARGGHEGSLTGTEWDHLEPVLFVTPINAHPLYIATIHMLKDRLDDGSIFSDDFPMTPKDSVH